MAVTYKLGVTDWVLARLRVINPHDLDVKNPTSFIDVPVIVQISFRDQKDGAQEYCHGVDNSDDSGRKYHIFRVCNQSGDGGTTIIDQGNWLDVERVECFPMFSAKERGQQFGRITGNTDLPGGWPAQPGDLSDLDRSGSFRRVYRYTTDNSKDGVPWIDMEMQLIVPQTDPKTRDDKPKWAKHGQVRAFMLQWFQDPPVPVGDATDPYNPSLGFCDPDLPLLTDNPLLTFDGIDDNSRLLAGEPPRFRAGRYPLPTAFVSGGAEDELPDDQQFPRCGFRFDPFQNAVNIDWSDCVEFEIDKVKVPPGEHSMGVAAQPGDVALLKQDKVQIEDFERILLSTWVQEPGDAGPPGGGEFATPYRIIEWGGREPPDKGYFHNSSYVQFFQTTADGATDPTIFANIRIAGPLKTDEWDSQLPDNSPWPCKFVDVPSEFFYTDPTAQFQHNVELMIDTKMKWDDFKDNWHHLAVSIEGSKADLASTASKVGYRWDFVQEYSARADFSDVFFFKYSLLYNEPFLPCAVGDLAAFKEGWPPGFVTDMPASFADAEELVAGNEFGPQPVGPPPAGYGTDGFPLPERFPGQFRLYKWANNNTNPPFQFVGWWLMFVVSAPFTEIDDSAFENLKFSVRFDGKVIAKTGDPVGISGQVPKVDMFALPIDPLTAPDIPPDDGSDLFTLKDTQVSLPRQEVTQAFDIPHRYAETQVWFQNSEYVDLTDDVLYGYFARKYEDPRNPGKFLLKPQAFTPEQQAQNAHDGFPADILLSPATLRFGKPALYFKGGKGSTKQPPPLDLGGFPQNRGTGGRFVKVNIIENFAPGPLKVPVLL